MINTISIHTKNLKEDIEILRMSNNLIILIFLSCACNIMLSQPQKLVDHEVNTIHVPANNTTPVIDGILENEFWSSTREIKNFKLTSDSKSNSPKESTSCYVAYSDTILYVAFRCFDSDMANIKSNCQEYDDLSILEDDHVSVFIDKDHNHRNYIELVVNPLAIQMDRSGFSRYENIRTADWNTEFNCFWKARSKFYDDHWTVEMAIDLTTLGINEIKEGKTIGFNLGRVRHPNPEDSETSTNTSKFEASAWTFTTDGIWETASNFYEPSMFGDLIFGPKTIEVKNIRFRSAKFNWGDAYVTSNFGWNPIEILIDDRYFEGEKVVLDITVAGQGVDAWHSSESFLLNKNRTINSKYFVETDKESQLKIELRDPSNGDLLYNYNYIITTPPFIEFNLEPFFKRKPSATENIGYRLNMDNETLEKTKLKLGLYFQQTHEKIKEDSIKNLNKSKEYVSFFNDLDLSNLRGGNYYIKSELFDKSTSALIGDFRQDFTKIEKNKPKKFSAIIGDYSFSGITDKAIRIQYPEGHEFVFWAAANYNPWWDIEQAAINYEHLETWGGGNLQGCAEVMQDRERRYSKVWLLENSSARVVVKWRYALADAHYNIHMNEWGEEFYTFYPDGTAIREVNLWANSTKAHEFLEIIPVKPGGVQSLQMYDNPIASLRTLEGTGYDTNRFWEESEVFHQNFLKSSKDFVLEFNLKERRNPFLVFSIREDLFPGVVPESINLCAPSKNIENADERGHWPASLYAIDGYNSIGTDRPRHGNIGSIKALNVDINNNINKWIMLIGTQEDGSEEKYLHGKSWLYPAEITSSSSALLNHHYDSSQRAYVLSVKPDIKVVHFKMSAQTPIFNPVFIIDDKKKVESISIDNNILDQNEFKVGNSRTHETIIFINKKLDKIASVQIKFTDTVSAD